MSNLHNDIINKNLKSSAGNDFHNKKWGIGNMHILDTQKP